MSEESERPPAKSIEETLAEVNSVLEKRYPLGETTIDEERIDGERTFEVSLARQDGSCRTVIKKPALIRNDVTFVETRMRMVKEGFGYGDKEGKVPLTVKHLGWKSELDSGYLQEGDVLLIGKEDDTECLVVSFLRRIGKFQNLGSWNNFLVRPLLGGDSWQITDMEEDDPQILGKVVRVEAFKK